MKMGIAFFCVFVRCSEIVQFEWSKSRENLIFLIVQQFGYDHFHILDCCFFCENKKSSIMGVIIRQRILYLFKMLLDVLEIQCFSYVFHN